MKNEFQLLTDFAGKHNLKTKRDGHDNPEEVAVLGKHGQLYQYSETELGTMFMPPKTVADPWGKWCPKKWNNLKRAGLAAGMILRQNGDSEGCLSFDPTDKQQGKLALKIAGAKPKRQVSDAQRAAMVANLAKFRFQPKQEGQLAS